MSAEILSGNPRFPSVPSPTVETRGAGELTRQPIGPTNHERAMRAVLSTLSAFYNRRPRATSATPAPAAPPPLGPEPAEAGDRLGRAVREASLARRALRGARSGAGGASGPAATMRALEAATVRELLVTARFLDSQPRAATNVIELARAIGATITVLSGVGAFELDPVAGGVGALLHRARESRTRKPRTA